MTKNIPAFILIAALAACTAVTAPDGAPSARAQSVADSGVVLPPSISFSDVAGRCLAHGGFEDRALPRAVGHPASRHGSAARFGDAVVLAELGAHLRRPRRHLRDVGDGQGRGWCRFRRRAVPARHLPDRRRPVLHDGHGHAAGFSNSGFCNAHGDSDGEDSLKAQKKHGSASGLP
jgi:hypothetical protein